MDAPFQITDDEVFDATCDCCGQIGERLHLAVRYPYRPEAKKIAVCRICARRMGV